MDTQAWSTTRVHHYRSCFHQCRQVPQFHCFLVDARGGWKYQHTDIACNLLALQDIRRDFDIIQASIGARTDYDLLNGFSSNFLHWLDIIHRMRAGYLRIERRYIDLNCPFIYSIWVWETDRHCFGNAGSLLEIAQRFSIWRHNPRGGSSLYRHIADCQASRSGHIVNCIAMIFNNLEISSLSG